MQQIVSLVKEQLLDPNDPKLRLAIGASMAAISATLLLAPGKSVAKELEDLASKPATAGEATALKSARDETKIGINRAFYRQLVKLLSIAFPKWRSKEGGYLGLLTAFLLLRTMLSLKMSTITGSLAKTLVETQLSPFLKGVLLLALWSLPAAAVNSGLDYLTSLLQLSFRSYLTRHFHHRYLVPKVFYKVLGLSEMDGVEQRVTQDVKKWSDECAALYATLFKPLIDIVLFSRSVAQHGGYTAPALIIGYYAAVTLLIRALAPNFGMLAAHQQRKDAALQTAHSKLLHFAEEVTLYHGESAQRKMIDHVFIRTNLHALYSAYMRAKNFLMDGILVKYGAVVVGYVVCAMATFSVEAEGKSVGDLAALYVKTSHLLANLAKAVGQFIMTYKAVSSLAGHTHRVYYLERGIENAAKMVKYANRAIEKQQQKGGDENTGIIVHGNGIKFDRCPIYTPDGTKLIDSLSFFVIPGMNLLIIGPNGCGKSSTFRLLGELWPLASGTIEKPSFEHLYYVPQRPYMSSGTFRDQLIYPTKAKDLKVGEAELHKCLEMASLDDLFEKHDIEWDSRRNWGGEFLSHGDKQKLAMARLFFHKPRFAILDECSSAIDLDVEQKLYQACSDLGITLITIAHRKSVWKYHNWVLRFDGNGGYIFSPMKLAPDGDLMLTKVESATNKDLIGMEMKVGITKQDVSSPVTDERLRKKRFPSKVMKVESTRIETI